MTERFGYEDGLHYKPLVSGGTTRVWDTQNSLVRYAVVESNDHIFSSDGKRRDTFESKGELTTATAQNLFMYLERHGIPTHFLAPVNEVHFVAHQLDMIPVLVQVSRFVQPEHVKREPGLIAGEQFKKPRVEFFFKNSYKSYPLMVRPEGAQYSWELHDPTVPVGQKLVGFREERGSLAVLRGKNREMRDLSLKAFEALEWGLKHLDHDLEWLQLELGIFEREAMYIGDLLGNKSWRLRLNGEAGNDPSDTRYNQAIDQLGQEPLPRDERFFIMDGYKKAFEISEQLLIDVPLPSYVSPYREDELITHPRWRNYDENVVKLITAKEATEEIT